MKFKKGQFWECRNGEVVEVVDIFRSSSLTIESVKCKFFDGSVFDVFEDGNRSAHVDRDSDLDLVKQVSELSVLRARMRYHKSELERLGDKIEEFNARYRLKTKEGKEIWVSSSLGVADIKVQASPSVVSFPAENLRDLIRILTNLANDNNL